MNTFTMDVKLFHRRQSSARPPVFRRQANMQFILPPKGIFLAKKLPIPISKQNPYSVSEDPAEKNS